MDKKTLEIEPQPGNEEYRIGVLGEFAVYCDKYIEDFTRLTLYHNNRYIGYFSLNQFKIKRAKY